MGALIGAAIGAVFWALVGILGYMASIVGFIIAYLADKGYDLLNGRQGTIKMVVRIVCVFLAVGNGTLGSYVWMIHDNYTYQYNALSEVEKKYGDTMTKSEYMVELLSDSDLQGSMLKDSAMGLPSLFLVPLS